MFSSNVVTSSTLSSLRNPRRRQRTSSDEGVKPPQAKRQRSALRHDDYNTTEGDLKDRESSESEAALEWSTPGQRNTDASPKELPLRGPRKAEKHGRSGVSPLLASYDFYTVSHLPPLPEPIRNRPTVPFRFIVAPECGCCLALTRDQAIVWPYLANSVTSSSNEVLTLPIPNPSPHSSDPLPLGTFISRSSTSDPGLVVVVPSTGRVTFWETLSNANVIGLAKQRKNGVRGEIPSMMPGEWATEIINAEPAGVIVTLSSGRFAHVTVRDAQGKPAVSAEFLRGTLQSSTGGILGGIRNVLSGTAWRRRIVTAKAGRSCQRGQRDIIIATNSGTIELWDTHWSNGNSLKARVDVNQAIGQVLVENKLAVSEDIRSSLQLLDFTLRDRSKVSDLSASNELSVWTLVTVSRENSRSYFIVGLDISESLVLPGPIFPLKYRSRTDDSVNRWSPRMVVPDPGNTAFVLLGDGVALVSLVTPEESPSTQLLVDTNDIPTPFQDYIHFRTGFGISGYGFERASDAQEYPSCIVMLQNFGLIRISPLPRLASTTGIEESKITAKSRLEQIVFYENTSTNPIDFSGYDELYSSSTTLENAALQVNDEILRSSSRFVATAVPSLEQQMKLRASALRKLAVFLKEAQIELSYLARWTLLWGAEKMAAQRAIWRVHQNFTKNDSIQQTHLEHVLEQMGEKFKTPLDSDSGETDPVRHWFIHDTWRMEYVIPWILNSFRDSNKGQPKMGLPRATHVWEASELSLAALETAYKFRRENAPLYGLQYEFPDLVGTSAPRYSELPEFWTSHHINCTETDELLGIELKICVQWVHQSGKTRVAGPQAIEKLKENIPRQFTTLSQLCLERAQWCAAQSSPEIVEAGKSLLNMHIERRTAKLFKMAAIGLTEEAIALAERFSDMKALVELMMGLREEIKEHNVPQTATGMSSTTQEEKMLNWRRRINNYFNKFGEKFGDAFFTRQIVIGTPANLLRMREYQDYLTRFLRKRPAYAKVGWINEVIGERDYHRASKALEDLAVFGESDLWSKKVEISIAKLAKLVLLQPTRELSLKEVVQNETHHFDYQLNVTTIQELIYEHMLPALHGAIDESAELQLANEQFGKIVVESKPALREALQRGLAKVVGKCPAEPDELIDVLTLMDPIQFPEIEDDDVVGREFALALKVLKNSDIARQEPSYRVVLEKMVWRRCMIRDNWEAINMTNQKGDEEVEAAIRSTALFRTLSEYATELEQLSEPLSQLYTPSQLLDTTIFPQRLASRLLPEQRAHLENDLNLENELLRAYIDRGRLDEWYSWILDVTQTKTLEVQEKFGTQNTEPSPKEEAVMQPREQQP
ncbi:hypothetical protein VTO42DRAFT_2772 [Malbranchea cinnamomea]